jgi:hypothetical protein
LVPSTLKWQKKRKASGQKDLLELCITTMCTSVAGFVQGPFQLIELLTNKYATTQTGPKQNHLAGKMHLFWPKSNG